MRRAEIEAQKSIPSYCK